MYEVYLENAKNFANCRCNRITECELEGIHKDYQVLGLHRTAQQSHHVPENKTEGFQEQEKVCAQNFGITLLVH